MRGAPPVASTQDATVLLKKLLVIQHIDACHGYATLLRLVRIEKTLFEPYRNVQSKKPAQYIN